MALLHVDWTVTLDARLHVAMLIMLSIAICATQAVPSIFYFYTPKKFTSYLAAQTINTLFRDNGVKSFYNFIK